MVTVSLLRTCGGAGRLLTRPQILQTLPTCTRPDATAKIFSTSPSTSMIEYFRARRGPFTPEEKQHGHKMLASTHWKIERVVAVSMIGILPTAIYMQGPVSDFLLSTTVLLHGYWGIHGVLMDYVEKFFPPVHYIWYLVTILGFAGLMHFNYNDIGVTKALAVLWTL